MDPEELADAYVKKADALAADRRYEEALKLYDMAIDVDPESCEAWTNKANVLKMLGRLREALECAERALDISPSPIAEMLSGSLLEELRKKGFMK
jgi:tetratricopeptide (TPR) repeat protein